MPRHLLAPLFLVAGLLLAGGCQRDDVLQANPERYVGIGVELTMEAAGARVVRVIEDGPAASAGLVKDDVVLEVEGVSARGQSLAEVVKALRGAPGSNVQVLARTTHGNKHVTVTRRSIENR